MKKVFNLILLITLLFIGIGSTFNNVDASAGDNNKSRTLDNIFPNGDFSNAFTGYSDYRYDNSSFIYADGFLTATKDIGVTGISYIRRDMNSYVIHDNIYYWRIEFDSPQYTDIFIKREFKDFNDVNTNIDIDVTVDGFYSDLFTVDTNGTYYYFGVYDAIDEDTIKYGNIMLFNLTDLYGLGNEPSLSEFETILEDAPDYFDEWTYNYYEEDPLITDFACERTVNNLITNGDFSNGLTDWDIYDVDSELNVVNGKLQHISDGLTPNPYFRQLDVINIGNTYYHYYELDFLSGDTQRRITRYHLDYGAYSYYYDTGDIIEYTDLFDSVNYGYAISQVSGDYEVDNFMVFDLSLQFGTGNEPTLEEWEIILDANTVDGYTDGFTYDDNCYMTIEQNNPIYQYEDNIEGRGAEIDIVMTETIKEMDNINPLIYIEKYNLNMNYVGIIYDGNISTSSTNAEGYEEHTFTYSLPAPVSTEEGYIYVAFDELGGNILSSGYVFSEVSAEFEDPYTDDESVVVRTYYDAIGINNSVYLNIVDDYQFNNNYDDYLFSNADNFMTIHVRVDINDIADTKIKFYSENTDQVKILDFSDMYVYYCDITYSGTPTSSYDCVFYVSEGLILPPLLNYLNSSITYTEYFADVLDAYNNYNTEFLIDGGFADNEGVFTYGLFDGTVISAVGETPLYYFAYFHEMELVSHEIREGRSLYADIYKFYDYLDDVYTYQYLYDNNTGIFNFDIDDNVETQRLIMEVFNGLTPEDATVSYHLKNIEGAYTNGASEDVYDVYMTDNYVMTEAEPFPDKVDNWMDMLGMNSALGKIIIGSLLIVMMTIFIFLKTRNVIAVLFVDFVLIALLAVLGIIPLWIILFLIMLFFGGLFLKSRGGNE